MWWHLKDDIFLNSKMVETIEVSAGQEIISDDTIATRTKYTIIYRTLSGRVLYGKDYFNKNEALQSIRAMLKKGGN